MIDFIDLTNAFADTFRRIPELVAALGNPAAIIPYIDLTGEKNSLVKAVYQMQPGTVMIGYQQTLKVEGEAMSAWVHFVDIVVKAPKGQSNLRLVNIIMRGIPVPGDGQRWYNCPLIDATYKTEVYEVTRVMDEEHVDYFIIKTDTAETGDA